LPPGATCRTPRPRISSTRFSPVASSQRSISVLMAPHGGRSWPIRFIKECQCNGLVHLLDGVRSKGDVVLRQDRGYITARAAAQENRRRAQDRQTPKLACVARRFVT
jgi:hypothetical protein